MQNYTVRFTCIKPTYLIPGVIEYMHRVTAEITKLSDKPVSVTWLATKQLKNPFSQLEKLYWKINYIVATEYIILA